MPLLTLKDAAEYVRTSKAGDLLLTILRKAASIFNFQDERENRLNRYIAVINAYQRGDPIDKITEKYKCTKRTVYDYVHRAGITPRSFIPQDVKAKIIQDYKNKIPVAKIAQLNDVSLRYVMKLAKEANLRRNKTK